MNASRFGAGLVAALVLSGCGGAGASAPASAPSNNASALSSPAATGQPASKPAATAPLIPLKLSSVGLTPGATALYVTTEADLFRKNGLDLNSETAAPSSAGNVAALISGQLQLVWGDGTAAVAAKAGGADLK